MTAQEQVDGLKTHLRAAFEHLLKPDDGTPELALATMLRACVVVYGERPIKGDGSAAAVIDDFYDDALSHRVRTATVRNGKAEDVGREEWRATAMLCYAFKRLRLGLPKTELREVLYKAIISICGVAANMEPTAPVHAPCDAMAAVMNQLHEMAKESRPS